MSTSTNAIMFYGICFSSEEIPWRAPDGFNGDECDWEEVLDAILGTDGQHWETREKARKKECAGVTVITHCSYDCPMYAVAIASTEKIAYRGSPQKVELREIAPTWDDNLRQFCELMGIKVGNRKPTWWMCSLWG